MHLDSRGILVSEVRRTYIMAMPITKQGLGQNSAVKDLLLSAAQPDSDSDVDQVLEGTSPPVTTPDQEMDLLRAEKLALRDTVEELERLLEEKVRAEQAWIATHTCFERRKVEADPGQEFLRAAHLGGCASLPRRNQDLDPSIAFHQASEGLIGLLQRHRSRDDGGDARPLLQ